MNTPVRKVFCGVFACGLVSALFGTPIMAALFFAAALVVGMFESGDKTRLQMIFATVGTAVGAFTILLAWSAWCWVAVGVCAFLVLTMKIDGGDGYGG